MPEAKIGVVAARFEQLRPLWRAVADVFPCAFESRGARAWEGLDAVILLDTDRESALAAARAGVRCLAFVEGDGARSNTGRGLVQFGTPGSLCSCFRGRHLPDHEPQEFSGLTPQPGDEVVATKGERVFWLHRREGSSAVDLVSLPPPVLDEGHFLVELFGGSQFLRLLPLLHFLREASAAHDWAPPPARACLLFDDPSLHTPRYGWINFRGLVQHARKHHYHAAIAMVPLDTWWVHARTAALFREHAAQLSLVIHGNDHLKLEMVRAYSDQQRLALLAQALRRMTPLEQQYGVRVSRVMEGPHGVVGSEMFGPMIALGYEAVLLSTERFLHFNSGKGWPAAFGLSAAQVLTGGLCGLPRLMMTSNWQTEVALAAFLRQPIVLVGHHADAAGGLDLVATMAAAINSLGPVEWCDLTTMARANYQTRQEQETLRVRVFSRRTFVPLPEGTRQICVERPWLADSQNELLLLRGPAVADGSSRLAGRVLDGIAVQAPGTLEVLSPPAHAVDAAQVPSPPRRLWPVARRLLVQVRDRAQPLLPRIKVRRRAPASRARG